MEKQDFVSLHNQLVQANRKKKFLTMTHEELCNKISDTLYSYLYIDYDNLYEQEFYYAEKQQEEILKSEAGIPEDDIKYAYLILQEFNKAKTALKDGNAEEYIDQPISENVENEEVYADFKNKINELYPKNFDHDHSDDLSEIISEFEDESIKQDKSVDSELFVDNEEEKEEVKSK